MRAITSVFLGFCLLAGWPRPAFGQKADDARAAISRAIRASGGDSRLTRLRASTWTAKGKYYEGSTPIEFSGAWAREAPDRLRAVIRGRANDRSFEMITVFDQDAGWISVNGKTHAMTADDVVEAREELYVGELSRLVPLKRPNVKLTFLGARANGGRAAVAVKVVAKGRRDVTLFFDKETGLLAKAETLVRDNRTARDVTQEILYSDYRDVDGLKIAFALAIRRDGKPYIDSSAADYKLAETLDPDLFKKP